jgi:hypothetical protein
MLPSFLICGGQRCGTTSLYRALAWHPEVRKAVLHKGVHYFDLAYHRGPRWYRAHFPLARNGIHTFESSPYYLYHPLAAARIAADLPGVKLIALIRDPVERAYSHHAHELARGYESEPDFGRALDLEPERLRGVEQRLRQGGCSFAHQHHAYRGRGEYVTYLRTMAETVGAQQIHVVDSAEFFARPETVYDGTAAFLGLAHHGYPVFERHNARPRANPMDPGVRRELEAHFRPYNEELAAFLGRDPSWHR